MALAYVQSAKHSIGEGNASSSAATFTNPVGSGSRLLIVSAFWYNNSGPSALADVASITDTLGTSFSNAIFTQGVTDHSWGLATWWGVAPSGGGADTVTMTLVATQGVVRIVITEVSGNAVANPFDQASGAETVGTTAGNSGPVTTPVAGELIYGVTQLSGIKTVTAGTNESFTIREDFDDIDSTAMETAVQAAAGSTSAQFVYGANALALQQVVTFKPPATLGADEDFWSVPIVQPQLATVSIW